MNAIFSFFLSEKDMKFYFKGYKKYHRYEYIQATVQFFFSEVTEISVRPRLISYISLDFTGDDTPTMKPTFDFFYYSTKISRFQSE